MLQKRYQRWGPNGLEWTKWFTINPNSKKDPWEMKNKLKSEYREIKNSES